MEKNELKPAGVFHYFDEICQVPRPSKKEEKMIAYLKAFGENISWKHWLTKPATSSSKARYTGYGEP